MVDEKEKLLSKILDFLDKLIPAIMVLWAQHAKGSALKVKKKLLAAKAETAKEKASHEITKETADKGDLDIIRDAINSNDSDSE